MYVAEAGAIRVIDRDNGIVSTLCGSETTGYSDGSGNSASFSNIRSIIFHPQLNTIIAADSSNNRIRAITLAGDVTTIAGGITSGSLDGLGTLGKIFYSEL